MTQQLRNKQDVETKHIMGQECLIIRNFDSMPPFLMTIVSDANHWLFASSNGGITAGRRNPDHALFPYYTEDKIIDSSTTTGAHTIITGGNPINSWFWEPFSIRSEEHFEIQRNLYKSKWGDVLIFEELNKSLELTYRYAWMTGDKFGFIKRSEIINNSGKPCAVKILDGIRNILPSGVTALIQNEFSCLIDAYKDSRRIAAQNIGIYRMSSLLTDRAEPSESLRATLVWTSLKNIDALLLSENQVNAFRSGGPIQSESQIRGRRGAFYTMHSRNLDSGDSALWSIVADVDQTQARLIDLIDLHKSGGNKDFVLDDDISRGSDNLRLYTGLSDGLQLTEARNATIHHYANTLFNIMRGGVFPRGYFIDCDDFMSFVKQRNIPVYKDMEFHPPSNGNLDLSELHQWILDRNDPDIRRLFDEYLPLAFSRRHGDPSRPWNTFDIDLFDEKGNSRPAYQGNWRDIFQNWEALILSFPEYIAHVIAKFLNAISPDGYNPYRITREGVEWEIPEPDNPWSNIGYWGDHQVIYLQRLLESLERYQPSILAELMNERRYSHADIPYRIRPYQEILGDFRNTIVFDDEKNNRIQAEILQFGSDARLVRDSKGRVVHSSLIEKLLIIILAKMANFIPAGGIWMNTQRPEWNDANNALVGPGVSVVTLCYLRRMMIFLSEHLKDERSVQIDTVIAEHLDEILDVLKSEQPEFFHDPVERRNLMDSLGESATRYRERVYAGKIFHADTKKRTSWIAEFITIALNHIDATLKVSLRTEGLYDSYNLLSIEDGKVDIRNLQVMLEGQVAILSSGYPDSRGKLTLLESLEKSSLYREDQDSYILYPDKEVPDFLSMNCVSPDAVQNIPLLASLAKEGNEAIVIQDSSGTYHFLADFRNAGDLELSLDALSTELRWKNLVTESRQAVLDLYEEVFDHHSFTGRSGTFYAYEGLGSIYWHMVSKLLLAAQEAVQEALDNQDSASEKLIHHYYRIRSGLSFNKTAQEYGAFITDPYSHSPSSGGAKQPGMTGQVKEEILTRWGELGVKIEDACLGFQPKFLQKTEYLSQPDVFEYIDAKGQLHRMNVAAGCLAFTYCGVPISYDSRTRPQIKVIYQDGNIVERKGCFLSAEESLSVFRREGRIREIHAGTQTPAF